MNLAEIRKKANREREESSPELPASLHEQNLDDSGQCEESIPESVQDEKPVVMEIAEPEINAEIAEMPESQHFAFNLEEDDSPLYAPINNGITPDIPLEPPLIAAPGLPAYSAVEYSAASAVIEKEPSLNGCLTVSETEPVEEDHSHSFDPVAILLAGRKAAGFGNDHMVTSIDSAVSEENDYHEFLCFRVGVEKYAINIMEIKEIIKIREVTEVPRVPDFITGVLSLRGIIIPVFNMVKRLHLVPVDNSSRERIIVVSKGEELFGIQVDEVLQVVKIAENEIEQPPAVLEGIHRDFVQGIGRYGGKMLILLNLLNILDVTLRD